MKSKKKSDPVLKPIAQDTRFSSVDGFALAFGLFLGLAILKFGNPVILDDKVSAPASFAEALSEPWPPHWSFWPAPDRHPIPPEHGTIRRSGRQGWRSRRVLLHLLLHY